MDMGYEHRIRERAYAIWIDAGMIDGEAERHWLHAEATLRNETEIPAAAETKLAVAKPAKATSGAATVKLAKTKVKAKPARVAAKPVSAVVRKRGSGVTASLEAGA